MFKLSIVKEINSLILLIGRRGFKMDRRPRTWCEPFDFKEGDPFTVASFSRQLKRAPIPPYPDRIPPTIPGHVSWHFWFPLFLSRRNAC